MHAALNASGLFLVLVTALSLVRGEAWWIRIWDYPRAQVAALIALVLGACLLTAGSLLDAVVIVLLLGAEGAQLAQIYPYTPLARPQVPRARSGAPERRVRVLLANVLMHNRRADALLRIVAETDPDLFLALETDAWWDRQLASLAERLPHVLRCPLENTYGLHFFSRLELRAAELRFIVEPDVPSVFAEVRLRSGDWIDFYGVHPRPPRPAQDTEERDAELLIVGREAALSGMPSIVGGDLNDVAWSHTTRLFQRISGLLDPRVGRGLYSTFHARIPFLRWPLDHLFHDPAFTLCRIERLGHFGSDHFPVLVELAFEPEAGAGLDPPRPGPGDWMHVGRKILKAFPRGGRQRLRRLLEKGRARVRRRRGGRRPQ